MQYIAFSMAKLTIPFSFQFRFESIIFFTWNRYLAFRVKKIRRNQICGILQNILYYVGTFILFSFVTKQKYFDDKALSIYDGLLMMSRLHRFGCLFVPPIFESYKKEHQLQCSQFEKKTNQSQFLFKSMFNFL